MHFTIIGDVDERKAERAVDLSEQKYCAVAASLRSSVENRGHGSGGSGRS
jgi:uncharacterized OsmC-like protein